MPDKREALRRELTALIRRGEEILESEEEAISSESSKYPRSSVYPDFVESYQRWYSLALPVVAQTLPERAAEFVEFYAGTKNYEGDVRNYIERRDDLLLQEERAEAFRRGMSQQVFLLSGLSILVR